MKKIWLAVALSLAAVSTGSDAAASPLKAIVGATVVNIDGGVTPLQALRSATIASATMLRAERDIGSLEVGKYADILAVTADPLKNISALRNITMIMKGGTVYRNVSADTIARNGP